MVSPVPDVFFLPSFSCSQLVLCSACVAALAAVRKDPAEEGGREGGRGGNRRTCVRSSPNDIHAHMVLDRVKHATRFIFLLCARCCVPTGKW